MIPWESCKIWLGYPLQNGVWPDVSKHGNDGTITGALWNGDSLEFDGVDDIVNCGAHSSLDITAQITLEALIKPYSLGEGNYGRILVKEGVFRIHMYGTDQLMFRIFKSDGVSKDVFTNIGGVSFNTWSHVIGTYNGSIQLIYLNGVVQTSTRLWTDTIKSMPSNAVFVGTDLVGSRTFDGKIAMVRIYNKAFTADQVKEAYEQSYRLI